MIFLYCTIKPVNIYLENLNNLVNQYFPNLIPDITGSYIVKRSSKSARHIHKFQYNRVQKVNQYIKHIDIFYIFLYYDFKLGV